MNQVEWIVEERIVLSRSIGNQTVETIQDSANRLKKLIENGVSPIHIVVDQTYLGRFPTSVSTLAQSMPRFPKNGTITVVGGNTLSNFIITMLVKLSSSTDPTFHKSMYDAFAHLCKLDQTLPQEFDYEDRLPVS